MNARDAVVLLRDAIKKAENVRAVPSLFQAVCDDALAKTKEIDAPEQNVELFEAVANACRKRGIGSRSKITTRDVALHEIDMLGSWFPPSDSLQACPPPLLNAIPTACKNRGISAPNDRTPAQWVEALGAERLPCSVSVWGAIFDACQARGIVTPDEATEEDVINMVRRLGARSPALPVYGQPLYNRIVAFATKMGCFLPPTPPSDSWVSRSLAALSSLEGQLEHLRSKSEVAQSDRQRAQLYQNSLQDQLNEAQEQLRAVTEQRDEAWRVVSKLVQK